MKARDAGGERSPTVVAFIGFGSLASSFAEGFGRIPNVVLRAYVRDRREQAARAALHERLLVAGVAAFPSPAQALDGADLVVAAVPLASAMSVAREVAPALRPGSIYIDPAPSHPQVKAELAALVEDAGGAYVDVAVLGTVLSEGYAVPLLASGSGARRWSDLGRPLGFEVAVVDGPAGRATLVKLLRSVYLKGRDALILETLVAARRYGLEEAVLQSVGGRGENVSFRDLAERVLTSLAVHAERRSDELEVSSAVLREAGLEPILAEAAAERLRWLSRSGIKERFRGERPGSLDEVWRELDALSGDRDTG